MTDNKLAMQAVRSLTSIHGALPLLLHDHYHQWNSTKVMIILEMLGKQYRTRASVV